MKKGWRVSKWFNVLVDSDSEISQKREYLTEPLIDFDYGYSPSIYYILTDYTIWILDIKKKTLERKIWKDPTDSKLNKSVAAFKWIKTLSSKSPSNHILNSLENREEKYSPCEGLTKMVVWDDYHLTIFDVRNMHDPVWGPVMHMIDEGVPRLFSTSETLPSSSKSDSLKELEDEWDRLLMELEGDDDIMSEISEEEDRDTKNNSQILCLYSNTNPWSLIGFNHDQTKNNVMKNFNWFRIISIK